MKEITDKVKAKILCLAVHEIRRKNALREGCGDSPPINEDQASISLMAIFKAIEVYFNCFEGYEFELKNNDNYLSNFFGMNGLQKIRNAERGEKMSKFNEAVELIFNGKFDLEPVDMGAAQNELSEWVESRINKMTRHEVMNFVTEGDDDEVYIDFDALISEACDALNWNSCPENGGLLVNVWYPEEEPRMTP